MTIRKKHVTASGNPFVQTLLEKLDEISADIGPVLTKFLKEMLTSLCLVEKSKQWTANSKKLITMTANLYN